jgi:hypothetical protein
MIKQTLYVGLAALSAWQLFSLADRYLSSRSHSRNEREASNDWENEGGKPAPANAPPEQRA